MGRETAALMAQQINNPLPANYANFFEVYSVSPTGKKHRRASHVEAESAEAAINIAQQAHISRHYDLSNFSWYVQPSYVVIVSYEMLCWKLPLSLMGTDKLYAEVWSNWKTWESLCQREGLDRTFNLANVYNLADMRSHPGDFWVSPELWQKAVDSNFAIADDIKNNPGE